MKHSILILFTLLSSILTDSRYFFYATLSIGERKSHRIRGVLKASPSLYTGVIDLNFFVRKKSILFSGSTEYGLRRTISNTYTGSILKHEKKPYNYEHRIKLSPDLGNCVVQNPIAIKIKQENIDLEHGFSIKCSDDEKKQMGFHLIVQKGGVEDTTSYADYSFLIIAIPSFLLTILVNLKLADISELSQKIPVYTLLFQPIFFLILAFIYLQEGIFENSFSLVAVLLLLSFLVNIFSKNNLEIECKGQNWLLVVVVLLSYVGTFFYFFNLFDVDSYDIEYFIIGVPLIVLTIEHMFSSKNNTSTVLTYMSFFPLYCMIFCVFHVTNPVIGVPLSIRAGNPYFVVFLGLSALLFIVVKLAKFKKDSAKIRKKVFNDHKGLYQHDSTIIDSYQSA